MNINLNSDSSINLGSEHIEQYSATLRHELRRFDEQITRIEVHLSDENKHKAGNDDKRCTMEARLAGLPPIVASHNAGSLALAFDGATDKLKRAIDSAVSRRRS